MTMQHSGQDTAEKVENRRQQRRAINNARTGGVENLTMSWPAMPSSNMSGPEIESAQSLGSQKKSAAPKVRSPRARFVRSLLTLVIFAAVAVSLYLAFWRANLKRFSIVREGVLIRSGQPTEFGLKHLIDYHGVKTILSLRQEDDLIHTGALDGGDPNGRRESVVVNELHATYLHWPMGGEAYWPWLPPKQFEEFFELFDNPQNLPVAVHCVAGRHRTGTLSALYRLEYDRWPVDRVLEEVHSFDFGEPIPVQLVNLRTYTPRPRPSATLWPQVQAQFQAIAPRAKDYEDLIQRLKSNPKHAAVGKAVVDGITQGSPFALAIARRLIFQLPADVQSQVAALAGSRIGQLDQSHPQPAVPADLAAAAAIVADFGTAADQQVLLNAVSQQQTPSTGVDSNYECLVRGVADRYTPNRIAYLQVLLDDVRAMPSASAGGFRYCDLAIARLTAIVNERFIQDVHPDIVWDTAVTNAKAWFQSHPEAQQLTQRIPPIEHRMSMDATRLDQDGGDRFR